MTELSEEIHLFELIAEIKNFISLVRMEKQASDSEDFEPLSEKTRAYIIEWNGKHNKVMFEVLCHQFTKALVLIKKPISGILPLSEAIRKVQLFNSELTSLHADLCQLCLLAKCFKPALEFLDIDVTDVSIISYSIKNNSGDAKNKSKFTPRRVNDISKSFLLYYYYGGMIYTALKNYERALYFFEVCITIPANALSHIMLEAYKKYILVCLILHGKVLFLPSYTSKLVKGYMQKWSQAYQELAGTYIEKDCERLQDIIAQFYITFERDKNVGLVKQVLSSLQRKKIQRLTNTFLTMSFSDVAARVKLPGPVGAEKHILNMIEDGEIFATINQIDGMVAFHDDQKKYDSPQMLEKLEKEMIECVELGNEILQMQKEVLSNPRYVRKTSSQNGNDEIDPQHVCELVKT